MQEIMVGLASGFRVSSAPSPPAPLREMLREIMFTSYLSSHLAAAPLKGRLLEGRVR